MLSALTLAGATISFYIQSLVDEVEFKPTASSSF